MSKYIMFFNEISMDNLPQVGGKNASLGEMYQHLVPKGIRVPDGFATTSQAYWDFLDKNGIREKLKQVLSKLDHKEYSNLDEIGEEARELFLNAKIPEEIQQDIKNSYKKLLSEYKEPIQVAVRSSGTAEDLPTASFAGQQESYLNIKGEDELINACVKCYASLFTARAIKYREDNHFDHMKVALSIGIQKMVRSDKACSGVAFTLDTETGFEKVIFLTGSWGLGENIVQGNVNPDEFYIFKPSLKMGKKAILSKRLGSKAKTLVYADCSQRLDDRLGQSETPFNASNQAAEDIGQKSSKKATTVNIDTPKEKRREYILNNDEIETLAKWCMMIEEYYRRPMDIEWAKDGISNELYIVQARPETVYGARKEEAYKVYSYTLKEKGKILAQGRSVGSKIASGKARILNSPEESGKLKEGEVLIADNITPDWDPIMKKASAIVTNKGGRTSHAAIIARELGAVAVVGTEDGTKKIKDGEDVTVSCAEGENGIIYEGKLNYEAQEIDTRTIKMPKTQAMMILGDPEQAFHLSFMPNRGIGLMRLEFVISNSIKIHPMALVKFNELKDQNAKKEIEEMTYIYKNKEDYFVDKLSQAVATIAAAFYPNDVIVRMSDFKTNEYANLIGGKEFEPKEDNPMLGFRGASRYYNPRYKEGFHLECRAMKYVREDMGLTNIKLMIPFCRTVDEGEKVIGVMEEFGLKKGDNGLEIYVMTEIPSNALLAKKFAQVFNGFSIGSNDLTQLTLGIDRDSEIVSYLFNENDQATKELISMVIKKAKETHTKVGLCGQAPSDFPEFAQFLVEQDIDSISFNPDALITGIENINEAEKRKEKARTK